MADLMKLHGIQFHRWPPATVIKSFGLEVSEPRSLGVEPGAGSRRSCTGCSEEREQRAALQSLPRVSLPRVRGQVEEYLFPSEGRAVESGGAESGDAAKEVSERNLGCVSGAAAPTTYENGSRAISSW